MFLCYQGESFAQGPPEGGPPGGFGGPGGPGGPPRGFPRNGAYKIYKNMLIMLFLWPFLFLGAGPRGPEQSQNGNSNQKETGSNTDNSK